VYTSTEFIFVANSTDIDEASNIQHAVDSITVQNTTEVNPIDSIGNAGNWFTD